MKTLLEVARNRATRAATWVTILGVCAGGALAQTPTARISTAISSGSRVTLVGSHPPMARTSNDTGRLASTTQLAGVTIAFARSAAQEADLQQLITAQGTKGSAEYRQWLTPVQFAARFGMADADIAKVEAWITSEGMTVTRVAQSKNAISFTGTAAQVEAAFGTEMHTYSVKGESHFAPATDLQIPAARAGTVQAVTNLSDFRPHTNVKVKPRFTSSLSGDVFMTPLDVRTIYDVTPIYNAGFTGTGETIAIVGQSAVVPTDITNFQTALGLTAKAPTTTLMPGTGTSEVFSGDETESDLDLEYSGALAPGATINFVYTGSNTSYGAFDALTYAVDQKIGTVISSSYGDCETDLGSTFYTQFNATLEQATSQGQSVVSAAGDDGSTDCYEDYTTTASSPVTLTEAEALAVDFPASSQWVTGIGGSEFLAQDVVTAGGYFSGASTTADTLNSAFGYVPEQVWNDDSLTNGLSSGGGGVSTFTPIPSWQTGVTGIPASTFRLVPDISLDASPNNAGYLYCSSDETNTQVTGSCANGLRASDDQTLTVAGGTSFGAPIFAGIAALIDQSQGGKGLGSTVNSTLYSLASTRYASVYHDITSGTNECSIASASICSAAGESEYAAGVGYDEASGLGSINAYNLLTEWTATLAGSATTLTPATTIPASGASDVIAITVASGSSTTTAVPTGSVTIWVDGAVSGSAVPLTAGAATYTFASTTVGTHLVSAVYSGDSVYAGSAWSSMVYVGGTTTTAVGSFTLTATSVTVAAGASGTSTVTLTPAGGYTGTVDWTLTSADNLADTCYDITDLPVTGTAAVTTTLTLYTNSSCANASVTGGTTGKVKRRILRTAAATTKTAAKQEPAPMGRVPVTIALGGVLMLGFAGRKRRGVRLLVAVLALGIAGLGMSGCGSSSSSSATTTTGTNQPAGSYAITIVGTDSATSAITASASLTLTVN